MRLPNNLRSGFINEDVENYLTNYCRRATRLSVRWRNMPHSTTCRLSARRWRACWRCWCRFPAREGYSSWARRSADSTVWLARAAGPQAEITYTDSDPENAKRASAYFKRAGVARRIGVETGDALTLLKKTTGKFDVIFNDIYKCEYPAAVRVALPRLRRAACRLPTDTLWSGKGRA